MKRVEITCDCCGKVIDVKREFYHHVIVCPYNDNTLVYYPNGADAELFYCRDCSKYLWKAIRAMPTLRGTVEGVNANDT